MMKYAYGCLFCKSGMEKHLAQKLAIRCPQAEFIIPEKTRIRRKSHEAIEETVILFPGYIFMRTSADFDAYEALNIANVYRVLADSEKDWRLRGADCKLAESLFELGGRIGLSTAYYIGDRIRIVDGFLKEYQGEILRVNRRKKTAQVRLFIEEKEMLVWLGFELIDQTSEMNLGEGE